jgi:hypothetical protein
MIERKKEEISKIEEELDGEEKDGWRRERGIHGEEIER